MTWGSHTEKSSEVEGALRMAEPELNAEMLLDLGFIDVGRWQPNGDYINYQLDGWSVEMLLAPCLVRWLVVIAKAPCLTGQDPKELPRLSGELRMARTGRNARRWLC